LPWNNTKKKKKISLQALCIKVFGDYVVNRKGRGVKDGEGFRRQKVPRLKILWGGQVSNRNVFEGGSQRTLRLPRNNLKKKQDWITPLSEE